VLLLIVLIVSVYPKGFCPPTCMCKPCGLAYALLVACAMMLIIEEQKESCFLGDVRMNSDSDCYASIIVRQKYQQGSATCLLHVCTSI